MSPIWPGVYLHTLPSQNAVRVACDDDLIREYAIIHRYFSSVVTHSCHGLTVFQASGETGYYVLPNLATMMLFRHSE